MMLQRLFRRGQPERLEFDIHAAVAEHLAGLYATGDDGELSAVQIAAGIVGRAFALADVSGRDAGWLTAPVMLQIGRDLMTKGESVWIKRLSTNALQLVGDYDYTDGGRYRIAGQTHSSATILHVMYMADSEGKGIPPLSAARSLANFGKRLEGGMAAESDLPYAYGIATPTTDEPAKKRITERLRKFKGNAAFTAFQKSGETIAAERLWLGPELREANIEAYSRAQRYALGVLGIPIALVNGGDAASIRESWRLLTYSLLMPLTELIKYAAKQVFIEVVIDFERLQSSDVQGRARAFQSLVQGGMDAETAAMLAGLIHVEAT